MIALKCTCGAEARFEARELSTCENAHGGTTEVFGPDWERALAAEWRLQHETCRVSAITPPTEGAG